MKKVIVRYFYSPICTESFATLDRFKELFNSMKEFVHFETFNTTDNNLESDFPWFLNEKEILDTIEGKGNKPLMYSKLFIEGKEIPGTPPTKTTLEKAFQEYGIPFPEGVYHIDYEKVNHELWDIAADKLLIKKYDKTSLKEGCLVCTMHNPYFKSDYMNENRNEIGIRKANYLEEKLKEENMIGFIVYYGDQPVGFVEAFPLDIAAELGFPVIDITKNGLMITCLNIRKEVSGNRIASKLINAINEEARNKNYQSIEVLAFADKNNWQPITFYQKHGFEAVKCIRDFEDLSLMIKKL